MTSRCEANAVEIIALAWSRARGRYPVESQHLSECPEGRRRVVTESKSESIFVGVVEMSRVFAC